MAIPYIYFLYIYLAGVGFLLLFGLSSLYHMLRFGFLSFVSVFTTFIMTAGVLTILFLSYQVLSLIDWKQSWDLTILFKAVNPF